MAFRRRKYNTTSVVLQIRTKSRKKPYKILLDDRLNAFWSSILRGTGAMLTCVSFSGTETETILSLLWTTGRECSVEVVVGVLPRDGSVM